MSHVRQSFNRAASSYDTVGTLQHQVATGLTGLVTSTLPSTFSGRILDAGCGTGYCLAQLSTTFKEAEYIAVDFAERMLQQLPTTHYNAGIAADIQHLPIATNSIGTYLSSLAWQWCNPVVAATEAYRVLKPQGEFFVATLATGTFHELAHCLQASGLSPDQHLLHYISEADIRAAITAAGFDIHQLSPVKITTWHKDFRALRHSIRGVGANHLPGLPSHTLNRQTRTRLIEAYECLRTECGLPLSYEVLMIHARKG